MKPFRLTLILLLLLTASFVEAKGPADKITISGPGFSQPLNITDPDTLASLSFMNFENRLQPVETPPQNLGDSYELTRYYKLDNGNFVAFDHLHYYRDPSGGVGYVFYDGLINGNSDDDGKWFRVTLPGERAIRQLLKDSLPPTPTPEPIPSVQITGYGGGVTVLVWSPDSQLLVSSAGWVDSTDHAAQLTKSSDGALVATLSAQTMPIVSAVWSPDSTMLATGSWDKTVELWQADGTPIRMLKLAGVPFGLSWSPDGKTLAIGDLVSTTDNRIELWSNDGTLLKTLTTKYSGGKFLNVGWSPDGKYLVGGATDYAEWTADGTPVFTHEGCERCTPAWGFSWSPDSQMWAIGNESGAVWVYNVAGQQISQLHDNYGDVNNLAWSPDGKYLAGGDSLWQFDGQTFRLHTVINSGSVSSLSWSPDSKLIASAANGVYVRVTDTEGHQVAALTGHKDTIQSLAWSSDGHILASGSADHTVRLWDMTRIPAS